MTHKALPAWLLAVALLILFAQAGIAQVQQQVLAAMHGSSPGFVCSGNRPRPVVLLPQCRSSGVDNRARGFRKVNTGSRVSVSLNVLDDADMGGAFRIDQKGEITCRY